MAELPRGTVTFLFTDIEGSTALWERDRNAMGAAVQRHIALLDAAIQAHGGVHFKTVGDAVQAAFPTAIQAVAAAVEGQLSLLAEDWGETGPLRVRMALHAGEAAPDARGDYLAAPLNRLSRLLSSGYGSQILLSQTVQQLTRGALPAAGTLRDLGEHRLRDLLEPERVYQLLHPDLPDQFPPIKTLESRPNNLPLQPTPFLGREREVQQVVDLLRRPEVRLLTLTGPGGTGKTRLGLQVAAEVMDDFPDGVWFVDLAPLTDPTLVPAAITATLAIREEGGQSLTERLRDALASKQLLLLLDNLEHLQDGAPVIAALLAAAPGLRVLATSRAPLRLRGEQEYAVLGLNLPQRQPPPTAEQLTEFEAGRLFVARAQAVRANFTVSDETAPVIAEICHRLDGLPLAIELAAARVKLLTPEAMLARLEQPLPLLTGGARDLPERQRTLRGAIAWSYDLLSPDEQKLFRRLGVFSGGWTLTAAEAVAGSAGSGELRLDVLEGLGLLVDHSLVRQVEGADAGYGAGEPRFGMLETIREYGLEALGAAGETTETHQRHAAFFLALAEEADPHLVGSEQISWLNRLETEHDNLRAALAWALEHDRETALRLGAVLGRFWESRSYFSEGRRWLERVLAVGSASPAPRLGALLAAGVLAVEQGDLVSAEARHEEALALARGIGDRRAEARALIGLAMVKGEQGDLASAEARDEEALALFREVGDRHGVCRALAGLAGTAWDRGELAQAEASYSEALALARDLGDAGRAALNLRNLAGLAITQGALDRAEALLEESLALARGIGDQRTVALVLGVFGVVARERGDLDRAVVLLEEGLALVRELGEPREEGEILRDLGVIARQRGELDRAAVLLEEALARSRAAGIRFGIASALVALAAVAREGGDLGRARGLLAEAAGALGESGDPAIVAEILNESALQAAAGRWWEPAARGFGTAEALRERLDSPLLPSDREEHERALTAVRAALGDDAFVAAWEVGCELPPEEAMAETLALMDQLARA